MSLATATRRKSRPIAVPVTPESEYIIYRLKDLESGQTLVTCVSLGAVQEAQRALGMAAMYTEIEEEDLTEQVAEAVRRDDAGRGEPSCAF